MTRLALTLAVLICAAQSVILWNVSARNAALANIARAALDESDESVELALAWKDIADRWHSMFEGVAGRCVVQGRAL